MLKLQKIMSLFCTKSSFFPVHHLKRISCKDHKLSVPWPVGSRIWTVCGRSLRSPLSQDNTVWWPDTACLACPMAVELEFLHVKIEVKMLKSCFTPKLAIFGEEQCAILLDACFTFVSFDTYLLLGHHKTATKDITLSKSTRLNVVFTLLLVPKFALMA